MNATSTVVRGLARLLPAAAALALCAGTARSQARAIIFSEDFRDDVTSTASNLTALLAAEGIVADTVLLMPFEDPGDLDVYDCAFDLRVDFDLDPFAAIPLQQLAADGGGIYLAGEHAVFATRNSTVTSFVSSLGGGVVTASPFVVLNPGPTDLVEPANPDHPLTTECNVITEITYDGVANGQLEQVGNGTWISGSPASAGAAAWGEGDLAVTPDGRIVVAMDVNYLSSTVTGTLDFSVQVPGQPTQNRPFAVNMVQWLCGIEPSCACAPFNHGWWHRECLGADLIDPGRRGGGNGPGAHPRSVSYDPGAFVAADAAMAAHGLTACQALDEGPFSDPRRAALRELATLHLDIGAKFLSRSCPVELRPVVDGDGYTVSDALGFMEARLADGSDEALREAAWIGAHVANREALIRE